MARDSALLPCLEQSLPHAATASPGEATWDLELRGPGTYTIQAWWAAAPGAKDWTSKAVYEVLADGKIVASKTLDQTHSGDEWHTVAEGLKLEPGQSIRSCGSGMAVRAPSSPTPSTCSRPSGTTTAARPREVTLEPMDGIVLRRTSR